MPRASSGFLAAAGAPVDCEGPDLIATGLRRDAVAVF
jgi:hypothetical protein